MLKKLLAGAAATAALMAPGLAAADNNAVVGFTYNSQEIESTDWDRYGVNGGFSHDFSNGTLLQFDGAAERVDISGCCISTGYAALQRVAATALAIAPLFFPILLNALGLLIGVIQAYIFSILGLVFIASATRAREDREQSIAPTPNGEDK